jgi:hypothetical protein
MTQLPRSNTLTTSPVKPEPFFRFVDWSAFWTATILTLIVYGMTLAPTVTLEDSGELAVGASHLGVPHPPGYPIWTILTWLFTKIFFFVKFRGQPNPAWSVAFASAVFGALTSGFTAILLCRSGRDMLRSIKRTTEAIGERTESIICWSSGVAGSLLLAFSPVVWSQAVIVEVYSLGALFMALVMFVAYVWMRKPDEPIRGVTWLILGTSLTCLVVMGSRLILHLFHYSDFTKVGIHYVLGYLLIVAMVAILAWIWRRNPSDRLLYLMSLTFGLGLTNYQVLLLFLAALAVIVLIKDVSLFRDFLLASIPFVIFYLMGISGALQSLFGPEVRVGYLGIIHPTHASTYFYILANFAWLALVYFKFPTGKQVAPSILCLELGLIIYAFMPLASETNPPINWGYPRTWEGFVHAITRGQYEKIDPSNIFSAQFIRQIGDYMSDLRAKFTLPVAILGILPFTAWSVRIGNRRYRAIYLALLFAVLAVTLITIEEVAMPVGTEIAFLSNLYRFLIFGAAVLMTVGVMYLIIGEIDELIQKLSGRIPTTFSEKLTIGGVLLGILLVVLYIGGKLIAIMINPALGLNTSEKMGFFVITLAPILAGGLVWRLMHGRGALEFEIDRHDQKWILATLSGFIVMSVLLIALANPKGDIQDAFIQRVKFIPSHALFAFWIGYGLLLSLATVDSLFKGNRAIVWAGVIFVLVALPAWPLLQNAYNKELIRTDGGAEQNSHDFGWQFGNYQLRGAEAITEELSTGEEPLPDPSFPPEMGPRAVFFGGTDPGRFVPTYMIYSADVRPDVYLITQNALADNTFMSVTRDLYGDTIWIPSVIDGNNAFQRYVEDVRTGKTPASADIKIEGGRVSVQGVGGVMLINGILAQMIFEHNKPRHDFFVEESYVIQWMYPYLTPHGLIMKINTNPIGTLPPETVTADMDFWDWYSRRLTGDRKFIRDIVARKSFSKLRSAIAGLYVVRGMFNEAEIAFKEAVALYELSPEANFRLADLYLRWNRPNDAIALMESFSMQDPGNDRAKGFVDELKGRNTLAAKRRDLEALLTSGKANVGTAIELAEIYRKLGLADQFQQLARSLLSQKGLPPQMCLKIAQMAAEDRKPDLMEAALLQYTETVPADMRGWIDLAGIQFVLNKQETAFVSLRQAVKIGKESAITILREDPRFQAVRTLPAFQQLLAPR